MKRLIIYIVAILSVGILGPQCINAQTPSVSSVSVPACPYPTASVNFLGSTCGNPDDICANRCCADTPVKETGIDTMFNLPIVQGALGLIGLKQPEWMLSKYSTYTENTMQPCIAGSSPTTPGDLSNPACYCIIPTGAPLVELTYMCKNIQSASEKSKCLQCLLGTDANKSVGVWTSVGCVYSNIGTFIQNTLLGWGVGFAGGISMLCIIYAAIMMQTSGGNAEKVKKAQQLMTSCITGLMIIIFSVFILQLIGVRILRIPGFG